MSVFDVFEGAHSVRGFIGTPHAGQIWRAVLQIGDQVVQAEDLADAAGRGGDQITGIFIGNSPDSLGFN
jgi:hypothetical protein